MNSTTAKVIAFFLSIFAFAYVGVQLYQSLYQPYETETMTKGEYQVDIDLNGFFVRDEAVIDSEKSGVVRYHYKNAQKVSKNAIIASIYASEEDLVTLNRLEDLNRRKETLSKAQDRSSSEGLKLDLLTQRISENRMELIRMVNSGLLADLDDVYYDMTLNADQLAVSVDGELSFDAKIAEIQQEIDLLSSKVSAKQGEIRTEESGYFSSFTDGYEEVFTPDMLSSLSVFTVNSYVDTMKQRRAPGSGGSPTMTTGILSRLFR